MVVRGGSNLRKDVRRPPSRSRCLSKGVGVGAGVGAGVGGVGERMGVGMFGRQTGREKEAPCGVVGVRVRGAQDAQGRESSCVGGGLWPRSTFWGMILSPALHVDLWPGLLKGVRVSEGNRGGAQSWMSLTP